MADNSSIVETKTLDDFYSNILSKDATTRLDCFIQLENYLLNENNSIYCEDLTSFINGLIKWIESSNYRVRHFCQLELCHINAHEI